MASEAPWKSLHPVSLVVNLVPRTWATLRSTWPLVLALIYGRATGQGFFDLALVSLFFFLAISNTVVHFLTLRYRVVEGRLEIKSGVLNRQVRVIGAERIQNVEMVRNVFHRMSGMVEVRIETASGTEVEGLLSALSVPEAKELIGALEAARGEIGSEADEATGELVVRNTLTELVWYGATGTRLGGLVVLFGLLFEGWTLQTPDEDSLRRTGGFFAGMGGVAVLLLAVSGAWVVGTVTAVVRHYGFRLVRTANALVAEQGLLTRRRAVVRPTKVQLVTVLEPLLRRLAGFSSVSIETAAAREGGDGTQRSEAVVPFVPVAGVRSVVESALPRVGVDPMTAPLLPPHPRALIRAAAASMTRAGLVAAVASWWLWPWGLLSLLLLPLALGIAVLDHRYQGWLVTDGLVVSRRGFVSRRTWLLARIKLQSISVTQGPILRRYDLAVLTVRVAGSHVALPAMAFDDALALQARLLRGAA